MPFIAFNKTTELLAADDLHINPGAVLYVEASRPDQIGHTCIYMLGQGEAVNAVEESIETVVSRMGGLIAAKRHYLAPLPLESVGTVYLSPTNVSYARPNAPASPTFWVLRFVDGSELRVMAPLPEGF